jgi:transposase
MPSLAVEQELSDRLWERVRPLLPPHPPRPKGGRPPTDDRACFLAIVHVLRSGCRWRDVPQDLPSATTCWRRHQAWTQAGVSELFLDATFVEARKGGSRSAKPLVAKG